MNNERRTTTRDQRLAKQVEDCAELKQAQINGEIEMIAANKNKKFLIPEHESERYVHVYTEIKNSTDGKSISTEKSVIVLHADQLDTKVKEGFFYGYDYVEIVHDPRKNALIEYNTLSDFKPGLKSLPQAVDLSAVNRPAAAGANNAAAKKLNDDRAALNNEKDSFLADKQKHDDEVAAFEAKKAEFEKQSKKAESEAKKVDAKSTTEQGATTEEKK